MAGITEEAGKAVSGIVTSIGGAQPLALALVVMNLVLLGYLFYVQSSINTQRQQTVDLIVKQQSETEKLLANCVAPDVTRTMLDHMQKITDTMLSAEQKEIERMQQVVNTERQRTFELRERERKQLEERTAPPEPKQQNFRREQKTLLKLPPLPQLPIPLPITLKDIEKLR